MNCWEVRGCDSEMQSRCPHALAKGYSPCPGDCRYAQCDRPTHVVETDIALLLGSDVDRRLAVKETCISCNWFLTHGPRIAQRTER